MARDAHDPDGVRELLDRLVELDRSYWSAVALGGQHAALREAVRRLVSEPGFGVAWVAEPGADGELAIQVTSGARTDVLSRLPIGRGSGLTGKVFELVDVHWVDEYFAARSITHDFDRHIAAEGITRLIAVPIMRGDRISGVLSVGSRTEGVFGDRSIERVVAAANSAALSGAVADRTRHAAEIAAHEERRRVAVELHDSVGAMLYAITAGVRGLDLDALDDASRQRLSVIEEQATEAARLLRESLRALHASPAELALSVALQADCRSFEERSGLKAHLLTLGELPTLSADRIRLVTASVREALLNVEKHAEAGSVVVTISVQDGELVIAVTDDGIGLPPAKQRDGAGLGLPSIAESLAQVGGRLDVRNGDGGGTVYRACLPV